MAATWVCGDHKQWKLLYWTISRELCPQHSELPVVICNLCQFHNINEFVNLGNMRLILAWTCFRFPVHDTLENAAKPSAKVTNCQIAPAYQLTELAALSRWGMKWHVWFAFKEGEGGHLSFCSSQKGNIKLCTATVCTVFVLTNTITVCDTHRICCPLW